MKLILIRFSYGLFLVIMQKTCTCTPIYFSVSWYDTLRCVPKHYFSINIIFLFPNCWSGAEMPCRMQKIESGLLTFTVFEMLRKTKKKTFTVDGEIRESANKWMNEWMESMLQQRWKKLQSCLLAQLIGHMCNRCHLSVSIVFIASLFLMAPFIHIHNWEQFKKEVIFIMFSTRFTSVNLLIFSPQKINAWNVCSSC